MLSLSLTLTIIVKRSKTTIYQIKVNNIDILLCMRIYPLHCIFFLALCSCSPIDYRAGLVYRHFVEWNGINREVIHLRSLCPLTGLALHASDLTQTCLLLGCCYLNVQINTFLTTTKHGQPLATRDAPIV